MLQNQINKRRYPGGSGSDHLSSSDMYLEEETTKAKRQKPMIIEAAGGEDTGSPANMDIPSSSTSTTMTVFDTKEVLMSKMEESDIPDVVNAYLEKNLVLKNWRDMVKQRCLRYIRERGPDNLNISQMASDLMPFALESIDQETKNHIKNFIVSSVTEQEWVTVDESFA